MEERRGSRSRFGQRGLIVGDAEQPLYSGALHYWRVDRADWSKCLRAMQKLGLNLVETYIPWSVHELAQGRHDWSGELDVGAFLDEVARCGMYAVVRPGPHINAELTLFGFPERVLRRQGMLARTARDTPVWLPVPPRMFPVPSYASTKFRAEVAAWFGVMAEQVVPRLAPAGPVVAVGVDNEAQMFFRLGAYDHDYHPDALTWWQSFAGDVEPPRAWDADDAERCVRWVQFKEHYTERSLAWVAEELHGVGFDDVALFHNLPPSAPHLNTHAPGETPSLLLGSDFYHQAKDYPVVRRRARYLVGSAQPLPFAPEVGMGGPPWLPPMAPDDSTNVLLALLASGVRGFNLYMTVDRERWYGAPIGNDGRPRPLAQWLQTLLSTLREVDWTSLHEARPLAVIASRCDSRWGIASSVADPLTPVLGEFLRLGPAGAAELSRDEAARDHRRWLDALERALALAQIPYDLVDERSTVALDRYRVVVLPTADRVDAQLWQRLHAAADAGVQVIIGPGQPSLDELGRPLPAPELPAKAGVMAAEMIDDLDAMAGDLLDVVGDLPDEWALANEAPVDCSVFCDPSGAARVVFVANRDASPTVAEVVAVEGARLADPFSGDDLVCADGVIAVPLAGHQVRLLRVV